jgi:hypothetical protein
MTIYSYLQGGLGNQMFQYAIARALSERYRTSFALNRSWFDVPQANVTSRELQLNLLKIKDVDFISEDFPKKPGRMKRLLQGIISGGPLVYYQKNAFDFDPQLLNLKINVSRDLYLLGYWQGFSYINSIRSNLQKEFQVASNLPDAYQTYLEKIKSTESVMVHIRRGDYVNSPSAAKIHGALPIDYYLKSIDALLESNPNAHFFIFSDDLNWARTALNNGIEKTFIEGAISSDSVVFELQLMKSCKHHIIANSSLSWWGAWLKEDAGGLVLAPSRWVNDGSQNLSNLLPPNWIRMPIQ